MPDNPSHIQPKSYEFIVFAEHFQFYVHDANAEPHLPIYWEVEDKENLVMIGDKLIGVGTVRDHDVAVSVEVVAEKPKNEDLTEWDHVVESLLEVPTGTVVVEGPTEGYYEDQRIEVESGTYGVRIYFGLLDEIDEEGFEGDDFYRVVLWKSQEADATQFEVIKQWIPQRVD